MSSSVRPFARASRNPENPDFLAEQESPPPPREMLRQLTGVGEPAPAPVAATVKHARLSCYATKDEQWDLHTRAVAARMTVNDYMRKLLFPAGG